MRPQTHWATTTIDSDTLVARLRAPAEQDAWRQVDARYGPLLIAFALRMGLDRERAYDLRQEAMLALLNAIRAGRFDRARGRLRDLLFTIARNRIVDMHNRRSKDPAPIGTDPHQADLLAKISDKDRLAEAWDAEWRVAIAAQCLREAQLKFKPETYLAFYLKAIEDMPSAEVADRLGKNVNVVDIATHQVRRFLREIRPVIEERF